MPDARSTFPLMRLPAEIRLRIYEYCLPASRYHDSRENQPFAYILWQRAISPNVIFTSRQIYHEALHVLHRQNQFYVPSQRFRDSGLHDVTARIIYDQGNRTEYKTSLIQCRHLLSLRTAAQSVRHLFFQGSTVDIKGLSRREREACCLQRIRTMHGIGVLLSNIPRLQFLCIVFPGGSSSELDLDSKEHLFGQVIPRKPFGANRWTVQSRDTARTNSGFICHRPKRVNERPCNERHYEHTHWETSLAP